MKYNAQSENSMTMKTDQKLKYNVESSVKTIIIPLPVDSDPTLDLDVDKVQVGIEHEHGQQTRLCTAIPPPPCRMVDQLHERLWS